ncbi:hypothetical protein COOONC_19646 [Cooperia oncophora]
MKTDDVITWSFREQSEQRGEESLFPMMAVPNLGPIEYIISTPSSHRVHHGRNPYCIDRNYGAVFSVWDRLFGTYEPERKNEEIAYGLVKPVASFDEMWCQASIQMINFSQVKAALYPPAYFPGMRTKWFFLWLSMEDHTAGAPEVNPLILAPN